MLEDVLPWGAVVALVEEVAAKAGQKTVDKMSDRIGVGKVRPSLIRADLVVDVGKAGKVGAILVDCHAGSLADAG